jgi:uncharacterized repeat protein (TIGR01451 family)
MKMICSRFSTLASFTLVLTLLAAGCKQTTWRRPAASGAGKSASPTATSKFAGASKLNSAEATWGSIRLSQALPAEATLGSEFIAELTITAQGRTTNVVVRDSIPTGASYVRSEPEAIVEGNELVWKIGNLEARQVLKHKIWFKADKEGTLVNCASIAADSRVCAGVVVGKPVLAIDKSGPETAILGTDITFNLVVKNIGTATARNVVVTDVVPAGMSHSTGKSELSFEVGDLTPGQAKPLAVTFKANQRGKICNTATATSTNTGKVSDDICTVVLVPGLKVEKTGTKEQVLGRNADYEIVVSNTGDITLNNVIISDTSPAETSIVAAPGGTISGNKATWTIAELKSGTKMSQTIKLTSKSAGTHCNAVTVSSGTVSDSAKACTLWKGIPALAFEVIDGPDPIQIGESTTYTIKVTNQGFADIHNVKVAASFGDQVAPVSTPQGNVSGKNVSFPPVAAIGAKQSVTYTITVKGTSVGDARSRISLVSDEQKTPVEETESTTVY